MASFYSLNGANEVPTMLKYAKLSVKSMGAKDSFHCKKVLAPVKFSRKTIIRV